MITRIMLMISIHKKNEILRNKFKYLVKLKKNHNVN